jgi:1,4-dihydroxy-2-naphthoate octaprenyltransferase
MISRQTLHTWYWAIRPFSLSASVVPVLVGSALAVQHSPFDGWLFVLILLGSLLVQSATNLIDEYADHRQESAASRKVVAPYKVISLGLLTSRQVLHGALTCFVLAALIGGYLVLRTGWPLIGVCLASLGVAYRVGRIARVYLYGARDGGVKFLCLDPDPQLDGVVRVNSRCMPGYSHFGG